MSDDEWTTVGNRKSAREGIDTRKKEGSVPQTYMGSAQKSTQYERERRSAYWEEQYRIREEENLARERQKQIDFQKSIRNTEANYPSLVSRATVLQSSSKPVLSFRTESVVDPRQMKRDRVEESKCTPVEPGARKKPVLVVMDDPVEDVHTIPPVEFRLRTSTLGGMIDERPEYLQVVEEEEDLDEKYGGLEMMDPEDGMAEWDEFELNGELEIVGREFDI
jgi:hypothetical protein